ncbi:MAG: hypothetical protein ACR2P2_05590 [Nakamurella sp.]
MTKTSFLHLEVGLARSVPAELSERLTVFDNGVADTSLDQLFAYIGGYQLQEGPCGVAVGTAQQLLSMHRADPGVVAIASLDTMVDDGVFNEVSRPFVQSHGYTADATGYMAMVADVYFGRAIAGRIHPMHACGAVGYHGSFADRGDIVGIPIRASGELWTSWATNPADLDALEGQAAALAAEWVNARGRRTT